MPPRAAHLDPRDAYCSRNPPPPHHPYHAMRPRSPRERLTPLGLAPPAYSRSQVQPLPSRRSRDASAAAHSPPVSRARATALPLFWQESDPLSLAPVRAPRTRESVPAASYRRSRRDVLPVGAALLSPARSLFPFSMPLSSTIFVHSLIHTPCTMSMYQYTPNHLHSVFLPSFTWS